MNCERPDAKSIFLDAIEHYSAHQWPAFLEGAYRGDTQLRRRVEELLHARREFGGLAETALILSGTGMSMSRRWAEKAAQLAPGCPSCWTTLGVANYRAGHWKEATKALDKSLHLRGNNTLGLVFLAIARWQAGQKEEARQAYQRALEHLPFKKLSAESLEEIRRLQAEAEQLLEIPLPTPPEARTRSCITHTQKAQKTIPIFEVSRAGSATARPPRARGTFNNNRR
ncbi:MAG: hypothetical protein NZ899_00830 [Thermoguttaceae bacterium]|nr:hypothetical protein [Thermoguttaceae bacterium]MDW8077438.1 hypothetical protein [Thermoguttaceae bacterium]